MKVFIICFIFFLLIPNKLTTLIEDSVQEKAKEANPLVVEKLIEKLGKYKKELFEAEEKEKNFEIGNLFQEKKRVINF